MRRQFAISVFVFGVFFVQVVPCAAAVLVVSPGSLDFTMPEGGENPSGQAFQISNGEAGAIEWTIAEDCGWLSVNRESGTAEDGWTSLVLVTVDAAGLGAGVYTCDMVVRSDGAAGSPQIVTVNLRVVGPIIEVSQATLVFYCEPDSAGPAGQVFTVRNGGGGVLDFSILSDPNWVSVSPGSGSSTGEEVEIAVDVDVAGKGLGTYGGQIIIESVGAENSPVVMPVTLRIKPPKYSGGSGTVGDPYQVGDAEDIVDLGNSEGDWGKHFVMVNDIDLSGVSVKRIGYDADHSFVGSFDGGGHVIRNLTMDLPETDNVGLFGYVGVGGEIRNLGVEEGNITGDGYVGGLAGRIIEGTITNCHSTGSARGNDDHVGGLVGDNDGGAITNCFSTGSVSGVQEAGGLVGHIRFGWVTNCYAAGSISGDSYLGGLVGHSYYGVITNCYATGSASGDHHDGGLVGSNTGGTFTNCYFLETSGPDNGIGTGLSDEAMRAQGSFVGWDFVRESANETEDIWKMIEGVTMPLLWWDTSLVYVTSLEGGNDPNDEVARFSNTREEAVSWYIDEESVPDWLGLSSVSGTTGAASIEEVSLYFDTAGMEWGQYWHTLYYYDSSTMEVIDAVDVCLRVIGPIIELSQDYYFVVSLGDEDANSQSLTIRNVGGGTLQWGIEQNEPCEWLSVEPDSGALGADENETISIDIETTGLSEWVHICDTIVSAPDAENGQESVRVVLWLGGAGYVWVPYEYSTIQAGVDAAVDGDVVVVADGVYTGDGNRDIDFKGKAITVRSENGAKNCVINCQGTHENPHRGFIFQNGEDERSRLEGFTIRDGWALDEGGGGIYCVESGPRIVRCIIKDCSAKGSSHPETGYVGNGGGILGCLGTISSCVISGNEAGGGGGGLCDCDGPIRNCIIEGNGARGFFSSGGGLSGCSGLIINCTIIDNETIRCGGGANACETMMNCIVRGNDVIWSDCGEEFQQIGPGTEVTYSNVEGGYEGVGNVGFDPLFVKPGRGGVSRPVGKWGLSFEERGGAMGRDWSLGRRGDTC